MKTVNDLLEYFDSLFEQDNSDILFASSYVRGLITLAAGDFGDDQQSLSKPLAEKVESLFAQSRTELSPQDQVIVANFWQTLSKYFL